jgi:hypothetical protein
VIVESAGTLAETECKIVVEQSLSSLCRAVARAAGMGGEARIIRPVSAISALYCTELYGFSRSLQTEAAQRPYIDFDSSLITQGY